MNLSKFKSESNVLSRNEMKKVSGKGGYYRCSLILNGSTKFSIEVYGLGSSDALGNANVMMDTMGIDSSGAGSLASDSCIRIS